MNTPVPQSTESTTRNWRGLALRVAVSGVLLAVLISFLPRQDLAAALTRAPVSAWATALGTYLALHMMGVAKWRVMINSAGGGISFAAAARCYYYGLFGNTFLPSLVGGDAIRVAAALPMVRSRTGVIVGSLTDRLLDVTALASVAGFGALLLPQALDARTGQLFLGLSVVVATGLVAGTVALFVVGKTSSRLKPFTDKIRAALSAMSRCPGRVAIALCLGIGLQALLVMLNAWLGRQCGLDIPLAAWLFAWPAAKISALVPVTQGGLGVREAALAALLAPLGVPPSASVAAGLAFQAIVFSGGLLGGLLAAALRRRGVA